MSVIDILSLLGLLATAAFAASGILAAMGTRIDLFGAVVVAVVTAIGGGTLRDLILDVPVFWLHDPAFMACATITGVLAFLGRAHLDAHGNLLAYLDAMGVALFASGAFIKSTALGLPPAHALVMGVITGIGGGLLRDTLTGRETLLVSPELYATPIIVGLLLQALSTSVFALPQDLGYAVGAVSIVIMRSLAIHYRWRMPAALINRPR
ncbi:hypothetical protein CKO42_20235 [Lamprobacter modestohalophilus]|uniref:Glycine transporter domain-containing protein n=1 Tax=Lamprobacter modestohalophilus TaxID=1064514 RepID=A0A9X1B5P0_9GAMM|nr:TRIC cation channel family protein [Lamprobacter modestohalophilus]MBK1620715.1 hypothetical protein [Lamprobacter modestohalophilus]